MILTHCDHKHVFGTVFNKVTYVRNGYPCHYLQFTKELA